MIQLDTSRTGVIQVIHIIVSSFDWSMQYIPQLYYTHMHCKYLLARVYPAA